MRVLFAAIALSLGSMLSAQEFTPTANFGVDVRIDYQHQRLDGDIDNVGSGFKGRYLNVLLSGNLTPKLSYNLRQRLNKGNTDKTLFDATDWIYLTYKPTDRWTFSAGKVVVAVGSCEYDKASIDIYRGSEFWHNIGCYQMGASAMYNFRNNRDQLMFQVSQSPFRLQDNNNLYAYNLLWYGNHGALSTYYSANLIETDRHRFISYLVVGNKIEAGATTLELDFINRASSHQPYLFRDCSVMAECGVQISSPFRVFAKATYDVNRSGNDSDRLVLNGTEVSQAGVGVEYVALHKWNNDVRLHACYYYSWGTNSNVDGTMQDRMSLVNVGLKWHIDVFSLKKR